MNLEEFRKNRKARLEALHEELSNMPELKDGSAHGEVDAVEMDAIKSSKERDELRKDSFKDKNKETREFVKKQDKDREVDKEEKSENRLILDESLFNEEVEKDLKGVLYDALSDYSWNNGNVRPVSKEEFDHAVDWVRERWFDEDNYDIDESLDDDAEFDEFKKKNPGYNKKFNNKEYGKYFDKDGKLIPDTAKEWMAKKKDAKDAKDESLEKRGIQEEIREIPGHPGYGVWIPGTPLNAGDGDVDLNDWKTIKIIDKPHIDIEEGEYSHNLTISHGKGKDPEHIDTYDAYDLNSGEILDNYIEKHLQGKVAKDESLKEGFGDEDPNNWKTMEIISESLFNESVEDGFNVIDDLVDRARLYFRQGGDKEDAIEQSIDDGLIYQEDILTLAEMYNVIDYGELQDKFYDMLREDIETGLDQE